MMEDVQQSFLMKHLLNLRQNLAGGKSAEYVEAISATLVDEAAERDILERVQQLEEENRRLRNQVQNLTKEVEVLRSSNGGITTIDGGDQQQQQQNDNNVGVHHSMNWWDLERQKKKHQSVYSKSQCVAFCFYLCNCSSCL